MATPKIYSICVVINGAGMEYRYVHLARATALRQKRGNEHRSAACDPLLKTRVLSMHVDVDAITCPDCIALMIKEKTDAFEG